MTPPTKITGATFGIMPMSPSFRLENAKISMMAIIKSENPKDFRPPKIMRLLISEYRIMSPRRVHLAPGNSSASFAFNDSILASASSVANCVMSTLTTVVLKSSSIASLKSSRISIDESSIS